MTRTATRPSSRRSARAVAERRLKWAFWTVSGLVVVLAVVLVAAFAARPAGDPGGASSDLPLPNPMGGPALHAPEATGAPVPLGGLEVAAPEVVMGDVPLNVTMVPSWRVKNPSGGERTFVVGQPQVHEGCCPGPVFVDEVLKMPGDTVSVPAGGSVLIQFPLQMHPGMDGRHHLTVPLAVDGAQTDLHVTGNFTADA